MIMQTKKKVYSPRQIEAKWSQSWEEEKIYMTPESDGTKEYVLGMFPYPSGDGLHVGHVRIFTAVDVMGRYFRMNGRKVLQPMGWDAFGLPAENAAIKRKVNPQDMVPKNEANFKRQLQLVGMGYDWDREFSTTDSSYFKWTQWLFLKLYSLKNDKGERLITRREVPINWCPSCKTGIANEEVLADGTHERCGTKVEQRLLPQWVMRITDYADRLLEDLNGLDWPKGILEMQKNWIGKKQGVKVKFFLSGIEGQEDGKHSVEVFTTRLDTIFGVSFIVIAPELAQKWMEAGWKASEEIKTYTKLASEKTEQKRLEDVEKSGVFTGIYATNPVSGEKVPVWIADYVMMGVGTGAVMGVPAHDERDLEFANKYGLETKVVVEEEVLINSGDYTGLSTKKARVEMLNDFGNSVEESTSYHLRDWVFSRQRYWGEPFPLIYCDKCGDENGVVKVPEDQLPVELPYLSSYEPSGTGESPLAAAEDWVKVKCPKCGGNARRETDTMPNWAGSCWYFLYFSLNGEEMKKAGEPSKSLLGQWKEVIAPKVSKFVPVNWYLGGAEHAVLHLLYARFWMKAFYDLGLVGVQEPFTRLRSVGMVLAEDSRKMSKSWGNVISPDDIVGRFGADALRIYEMFMGPWDQAIAWDTRSLVGCYRFLEKVWKLSTNNISAESETKLAADLNKLIKKASTDIVEQKFNTTIAALMEFSNSWSKANLSNDDLKRFLQVLAPFAPFISEEIWHSLGEKTSIHISSWPEAVEVRDEMVKLVVQVNGKTREVVEIKADEAKDQAVVEELTRANPRILKWLEGGERVVFVPGRLINFVAK